MIRWSRRSRRSPTGPRRRPRHAAGHRLRLQPGDRRVHALGLRRGRQMGPFRHPFRDHPSRRPGPRGRSEPRRTIPRSAPPSRSWSRWAWVPFPRAEAALPSHGCGDREGPRDGPLGDQPGPGGADAADLRGREGFARTGPCTGDKPPGPDKDHPRPEPLIMSSGSGNGAEAALAADGKIETRRGLSSQSRRISGLSRSMTRHRSGT